ncbi:MAG: hypothetical protein KAI79_06635 [Bacteroidales bacterium]|nr:hypothetical protein [Bacteroidales bacterium]
MKKHNGMRPQDIAILLKIITLKGTKWNSIELASALKISPSEISEALNRCRVAKLIDTKKRKVYINSFKEFLIYGLKYVFPVEPGAIVRGIPTAHSAYPINKYIASSKEIYVWSYLAGTHRGQAIKPLYKTLPVVASKDNKLYELLVIIDAIRIGRVREREIAIKELEKRLNDE